MAAVFPFFTEIPVMHSKQRCLRRSMYPNRFFDNLNHHLDLRVVLPDLFMEKMEPRIFDTQQQKQTTTSRQTSQAVVSIEKDQFHIKLNTTGFSPEELMVKVVGDKIHVSGKREDKSDDCYEYQEMQRMFSVPDGVDPNAIVSKLSKTGELIIEAPMKTIQNTSSSRSVPIQKELEDEKTEEKSES